MTKNLKQTFSASIKPKAKTNSVTYWFQSGKLVTNQEVDFSRHFSSHKDFRTVQKFITFLRWLESTHKDVVVHVWEKRPEGDSLWEIPMGDNWKEYFKEKYS
jgi:hypothetical protein